MSGQGGAVFYSAQLPGFFSGVKSLSNSAGLYRQKFSGLQKGLTIPEVASVSGHKTASMLMRYAHPDPAKVRQKMMQ